MKPFPLLAVACLVCAGAAPSTSAELPEPIAAPGHSVVATLHAQGIQLYECKADAAAKLTWQFREPVATLIADGRTVGRHYAGPNWELSDGSAVTAKVAGRAPGASPQDIPQLKLEVTDARGSGLLTGVTLIQRINTKGGTAEGACEKAGAFLPVVYSADYAFLKKSQ